jgi:hypothetical protein
MISSGLMTRSGIGICVLVTLGGLAELSSFLTPTALSQKQTVSKPSLAGQWVIEKSKKSSKGVVDDLTVLIQQDEPEIRITRRASLGNQERVDNLVYYADGRGETNTISPTTTSGDTSEIKSVTKWEGNKLMIRSRAKESSKGRQTTIEAGRIEKWQISKDGLLYWTTSSTFEGTGPVVEAMVKANILRAEEIRRVFRRVQ